MSVAVYLSFIIQVFPYSFNQGIRNYTCQHGKTLIDLVSFGIYAFFVIVKQFMNFLFKFAFLLCICPYIILFTKDMCYFLHVTVAHTYEGIIHKVDRFFRSLVYSFGCCPVAKVP